MYLNQFTNTKNSVQALSLHYDKRLQWIYVRRGEQKYLQIVCFFSSTKMTCDILFHTLSASKMSSTRCILQIKKRDRKKKKGKFGRKKNITVPQNCFDFTASVPLQNYLHRFKEHSSTALNIYHN